MHIKFFDQGGVWNTYYDDIIISQIDIIRPVKFPIMDGSLPVQRYARK